MAARCLTRPATAAAAFPVIVAAMPTAPTAARFRTTVQPPSRRRDAGAALLWGLILSPSWKTGPAIVMFRTLVIRTVAVIAFGIAEQWPARLLRWIARAAGPAGRRRRDRDTAGRAVHLCREPVARRAARSTRGSGSSVRLRHASSSPGLLFAPWVASVTSLVRQARRLHATSGHRIPARTPGLERKAVDAHACATAARVEPHFLFNTLANVRELVDSGSPQASDVLGSLIAYLRAAFSPSPRSGDARPELDLVRAISSSCRCACLPPAVFAARRGRRGSTQVVSNT